MPKKLNLTPEEKVERRRQWFRDNAEKIKAQRLKKRLENPEEYKRRYEARAEKRRAYKKEYYQKNKDKICARVKANYKANPGPTKKRVKEWCKENREHVNKKQVEYVQNNLNAKLKSTLRSRVGSALKAVNGTKCTKTMELVGCSMEFLKAHLEKQFQPGMTWENYGKKGWVIDHIVPCALFDLTKDYQQKSCFKWENLQPMWWKDNLNKHAKLEVCPV